MCAWEGLDDPRETLRAWLATARGSEGGPCALGTGGCWLSGAVDWPWLWAKCLRSQARHEGRCPSHPFGRAQPWDWLSGRVEGT